MHTLTRSLSICVCLSIGLLTINTANAYSSVIRVKNYSNSSYVARESLNNCVHFDTTSIPAGGTATLNLRLDDTSQACNGDREKFETINLSGRNPAKVNFREQELGGFYEMQVGSDPGQVINVQGNTISIGR